MKAEREKVTMNKWKSEWWEGKRGGSEKQSDEKEGGVASHHQKLFCAVILLCFLYNKVSYLSAHSTTFGGEKWGKQNIAKRRFAFFRFCTCGTVHERATEPKWGTKGASVDEGTITDIPSTLNNLSVQTLKQLHSVTFVYKPHERVGWPAHIPLLGFKWQEAFIVSGRVH